MKQKISPHSAEISNIKFSLLSKKKVALRSSVFPNLDLIGHKCLLPEKEDIFLKEIGDVVPLEKAIQQE